MPEGLKVLLVEHDRDRWPVIEAEIRRSGARIEIDLVDSAGEALAQIEIASARERDYDLLLAEAELPGVLPAEFMRLVRERSPAITRAMLGRPVGDESDEDHRSSAPLFPVALPVEHLGAFVRHVADAKTIRAGK